MTAAELVTNPPDSTMIVVGVCIVVGLLLVLAWKVSSHG